MILSETACKFAFIPCIFVTYCRFLTRDLASTFTESCKRAAGAVSYTMIRLMSELHRQLLCLVVLRAGAVANRHNSVARKMHRFI